MTFSGRVYDFVMRFWPWGKHLNRLANLPLLEPTLRPCFGAEGNHAVIIPVREAVRGAESVVLPLPIIASLVEQASARFILDECLCRIGEDCRAYPRGLGCLFLGKGTSAIPPAMGQSATTEQALQHAQRAIDQGLVPLIVHSSFDAWLLGIPYRRVLSICFCCDCCCSVRQGLRLGPPAFWRTVQRLPGLTVTVGPACTGCGLCLGECYVDAISLTPDRAHIGDACKGCGRCAAVCPEGAITLHAAPENQILSELLATLAPRTDFRS
jgi:UDP-glucose 4-epimerase